MFGEEMSGTEMSGANIYRGVHQAEDISIKGDEMLIQPSERVVWCFLHFH